MKSTTTVLRFAFATSILALSAFAADTPQAPSASTAAPTTSASAEGGHGRASRQERRSELRRLADELGLSKEQQRQLRDVFRQRNEALKALPKGDRRGSEAKKIREEYRAKARALLTPEQQTKFDAMKDEAKERRHAGS